MRRLLALSAIAAAALGAGLPAAQAEDTCYLVVAGNTGTVGACVHPDCSEECYPPSVYLVCSFGNPVNARCASQPLP